MGLTPDVFWRMSLLEWNDAVAGFVQSKGVDTQEPFLKADLEELERQVDGDTDRK